MVNYHLSRDSSLNYWQWSKFGDSTLTVQAS